MSNPAFDGLPYAMEPVTHNTNNNHATNTCASRTHYTTVYHTHGNAMSEDAINVNVGDTDMTTDTTNVLRSVHMTRIRRTPRMLRIATSIRNPQFHYQQ